MRLKRVAVLGFKDMKAANFGRKEVPKTSNRERSLALLSRKKLAEDEDRQNKSHSFPNIENRVDRNVWLI